MTVTLDRASPDAVHDLACRLMRLAQDARRGLHTPDYALVEAARFALEIEHAQRAARGNAAPEPFAELAGLIAEYGPDATVCEVVRLRRPWAGRDYEPPPGGGRAA